MSRRNGRVTGRLKKRTPKRQDRSANKLHFMDRITPEAANANVHESGWRKSAAVAIQHKVSRRTAYKRRKRHDGTLESLKDRSRAPHSNVRRRAERARAQVMRHASAHSFHNVAAHRQATARLEKRTPKRQDRSANKLHFMDSITPEAANANAHESGRRKSAAAAIQHKVSRRTAYKRRKRYDGTLESLKDRSRAPRRNVRRRRRRGRRSCAMRSAHAER